MTEPRQDWPAQKTWHTRAGGRAGSGTDRWLIVTGDDFGLSPGINRGILEAYRDGILTSASLMATGDAFDEAVALARAHPGLSVGIHLTLVEGAPVLPAERVPSLVGLDGRFFGSVGAVVRRWLAGRLAPDDVRREFVAQVEKVREHGVPIDTLNGHMHLHLLPGIFPVVLAVAQQYGIRAVRLASARLLAGRAPASLGGWWRQGALSALSRCYCRRVLAAGLLSVDHFEGLAESGRLTEQSLVRILDRLRPGVTELMVHPGYGDAILARWPKSSRYAREAELRALTAPRVKQRIRHAAIRLVSYRALTEWRAAP